MDNLVYELHMEDLSKGLKMPVTTDNMVCLDHILLFTFISLYRTKYWHMWGIQFNLQIVENLSEKITLLYAANNIAGLHHILLFTLSHYIKTHLSNCP